MLVVANAWVSLALAAHAYRIFYATQGILCAKSKG